MKIYIKNMVSQRCINLVKDELVKLGISVISIELGIVEITDALSDKQKVLLKNNLFLSGLELIEDKKVSLVERIKNILIEMIHYADEMPTINYSVYLSQQLKFDYVYLSNIFSEIEGKTIQQFIILHKIEKVKELLFYDEYNLTQISYLLNYSSVAHLSNQFKKITGYSPSSFKKQNLSRTSILEKI